MIIMNNCRLGNCTVCYGHCPEKEEKWEVVVILYTQDHVKHRFIAHKKNFKQHERNEELIHRSAGGNRSLLARFGHLKGKSVKIEYFIDPGNASKRILLNMTFLL